MKILFVDSTHSVLPEMLIKAGFEVCYSPEIKKKDIPAKLSEFQGVIIRSKIRLTAEILASCKKLKFIGRVGAGMENIDFEAAKNAGIECFNSPEGNRDAVGEQALGMLLVVMNNLCRADKQVRNGQWNRELNRGVEIMGKTIGIIGYGNMGKSFAKRLRGFGANVISYDKYKNNYTDDYTREETMRKLFEKTDILSLHVPQTDETEYLVNDEFISKFKKDIFLVNTARGKIVKTKSLVNGLKSGKIRGAALDVLEYESVSFENLHANSLPSDFQYLINSDKVVLSPHIAGWTVESNIKLATFLAQKIIAQFKQ